MIEKARDICVRIVPSFLLAHGPCNHSLSSDQKRLCGYYLDNIRFMDIKAFSLRYASNFGGLYYIIIYISRKPKTQYLNLAGLFLLA